MIEGCVCISGSLYLCYFCRFEPASVKNFQIVFRYNAKEFIDGVTEFVAIRLRRHKQHEQIRFALYRKWYVAMQLNGIGTDRESPNYAWPVPVLDYLRCLIPDRISGEVFENSYEVSMETLMQALKVSKSNK